MNNWVDRDDNVPGSLYLINRVGSDDYKIGLTRHLEKRFSQLQCGCPEPLKFVHTVKVERMLDGEQYLHRTFASHRTRGEWFSFNNSGTIQKVIREMNKLAGVEEVSRVEKMLNELLLIFNYLGQPRFKQRLAAIALTVAGIGFAIWVPLPKQQNMQQSVQK